MPKAERRWTHEPFRHGTPEDFARARELLVRTGYEEAPLCARAEVTSIFDFPALEGRTVFRDVTDAQSLLVHLFLDGVRVEWDAVRSLLGGEGVRVLEALGLLHPAPERPSLCMATVSLYPIEELYIAADRRFGFDSTSEKPPADLVYPPFTPETGRFLRLMPREPCDRLLDLGTGSGVAALVAARWTREVIAVDVAERSVRFTEFNAALNAITNVRALVGDLYEPIGGETFDRIVAHPPYVPAFETELVFRDGGVDGEQVTRRIIEGLVEHLRPGGQFFCDCMLTERHGAPVDERVRELLGDSRREFDVVIAQGRTLDPLHFLADQARAGLASFDTLGRWSETLERLEIEGLIFVVLLVQRRDTDRPVIVTRRALSPLTSAADLQWVLRWMIGTVSWDATETRRLLASRPRTLPRTELRSRSVLHDGQWGITECLIVTLSPFAVEAACPLWYATLLQFCDGTMTARDHLQYLRDTRAVPDSASEDAFAMMIRQLVDAGLVEIDEFRLPDTTAMRDAMALRERATVSAPVERAD